MVPDSVVNRTNCGSGRSAGAREFLARLLHLDARDRLARDERDDVDLVDHRVVDEHRLAEVRRRGRVAVRVVQREQCTVGTGLPQRAELLVALVEPTHEPDLDLRPVRRGLFELDDPQRVLGARRERLLAQHGQTALDRRHQDRLVQEPRRGDDDRVDLGAVEGVLERRGGDRARRVPGGGGRTRGVGVDDRDDVGAGDGRGDATDVVAAHGARADDGDAEVVSGAHAVLLQWCGGSRCVRTRERPRSSRGCAGTCARRSARGRRRSSRTCPVRRCRRPRG